MCQGLAHFVIGEFPRPGGRSVLVGDTDLSKIGSLLGPGCGIFRNAEQCWNKSWEGKKRLSTERLPLSPPTQRELLRTSFIKTDQKSAFLEQTSNTAQETSGVPIHPYIGCISYLEGYPRDHVAREMMRYIANEIAPVMKAHNWTVDHFTEFIPGEERLLGQNTSCGRIIQIRLRKPCSYQDFESYDMIMGTVLHELVHNTYGDHDHDFWAQLSRLVAEQGIVDDEADVELLRFPYEPPPVGHVVIVTKGRKLYLLRAAYEEHFSNCWRQSPQSPGCILPRYFDPSVISRLVYIAKGIEPDTWTDRDSGINDNYRFASSDATWALKLCLRMYQEGEIVGWHSSSREWLARKLAWIITWDPRTQNRPFTTPLGVWPTPYHVTRHFAEAVRYIYRETTPSDKCLRDKVAEVLREMARMCHEEPGYWNTDILDALMEDTPGLRSDCKWIDSGDYVHGQLSPEPQVESKEGGGGGGGGGGR